jgi:hypothetical protein
MNRGTAFAVVELLSSHFLSVKKPSLVLFTFASTTIYQVSTSLLPIIIIITTQSQSSQCRMYTVVGCLNRRITTSPSFALMSLVTPFVPKPELWAKKRASTIGMLS